MKKIIQITTSAALAVSLLVVAPVAVAATNDSTSTSSTPASSTTATTKKTLAERITEYKTKQAVKLTAAQEAALKTKCKAAQVISKALTVKVSSSDKDRVKVYDEISKTLTTITTRLGDAEVDTRELKTQQEKLAELIATYKTDVAAYTSVLTDLNDIDCVADPVGFKTTLEVARTSRALISKDALAIRTYLTDTVKPALKAAQDTLETDTTTTQENQ